MLDIFKIIDAKELPLNINDKIIVSFTSYPGRIEQMDTTLNSIYHLQTKKPDYIFLTLAKEEFPNGISDEIKRLQSEIPILKITYIEKNIYTFKKWLPIAKHYLGQNYILFSIDDDIKYHSDYIESSLSYMKETNAKICSLHHFIGPCTLFNSDVFSEKLFTFANDDFLINNRIADIVYLKFFLKFFNTYIKEKQMPFVNVVGNFLYRTIANTYNTDNYKNFNIVNVYLEQKIKNI